MNCSFVSKENPSGLAEKGDYVTVTIDVAMKGVTQADWT